MQLVLLVECFNKTSEHLKFPSDILGDLDVEITVEDKFLSSYISSRKSGVFKLYSLTFS